MDRPSANVLLQRGDLLLAVFVIAIAALLLVPLPTPLLDVLLVLNISLAVLLLLVGLYLPNSLALLSFPSILLLTTLFRLSLNVASTRLILSQGDAGRVIEAFGTFLVRGELAVGVIIFTIITIVNFIVIAKGAGRVSEVAARFALDALPGKQSAIDADLRAGLITATEAQSRREDLRRESQLYGAMDGAMNFVQGDAVAGFFIIITNIVGGIYIGISNGLSINDAVHTYTILTVGDGLVTQIPALLISICAGIVVTRVSSRDGVTLGNDLGNQLFKRPATVALAALVLLSIGFLPGLPAIPFIFVAGIFLVVAARLYKRDSIANIGSEGGGLLLGSRALLALPGTNSNLQSDLTITLALDSTGLFPLYERRKEKLLQSWAQLRGEMHSNRGLVLPELSVLSDDNLTLGGCRATLAGEVVYSGTVRLDGLLIEVQPEQAELLGLAVKSPLIHPVTGARVSLTEDTQTARELAAAAGIRALEPLEVLASELAATIVQSPERLLSLGYVHSELRSMEKKYPGLFDESLDRRFINAARLTEVLHELARSGAPIKEMGQIVEGIAAYCAAYAQSSLQPTDFEVHEIVNFLRQRWRLSLITPMLSSGRALRAISLSPGAEELLDTVTFHSASKLPEIEPSMLASMKLSLESRINSIRDRGVFPVAVLCRAAYRAKINGIVAMTGLRTPVFAIEEIPSDINIERVGVWLPDSARE